jgi:hypothetical protein
MRLDHQAPLNARSKRLSSLPRPSSILNTALCASIILIAQIVNASAQVAISSEKAPVTDDSPSQFSRAEWQAHINEVRKRVRASAGIYLERSRNRREPTTSELSREATERVLKDYSLVRGDIVMTDNGMFVFKGRSGEEPKDTDFEPLQADGSRGKVK